MTIKDIQDHIIGIYKINYPNGKYYIGLSNDIKRRIREHWNKDDGQPSHYAIKKYFSCREEIEFDILEQIPELDYNILSDLEQKWIKYYDCANKEKGYNLTPGGIELNGNENPFSTLNKAKLEEIYYLLQQGFTNIEISNKFDISEDTVGRINVGKTYYNQDL